MHDQARKRMNATCNNSHFSFGKNSSRQPIPNLLNESVFNDNHSVASIVPSSVISAHAMGHVESFSKTAFGSSILIIIVSPVTILANILLLVTFFAFSILRGEIVLLSWNLQVIFRHFQSQYRHPSFFPSHWRSISWWHRLWSTAAWLQRRKLSLALLQYISITRLSAVYLWWVFRGRPETPSTYSFTTTLLFSSPSRYTLFCITPWERKWLQDGPSKTKPHRLLARREDTLRCSEALPV